jgi:hypothetical protein
MRLALSSIIYYSVGYLFVVEGDGICCYLSFLEAVEFELGSEE